MLARKQPAGALGGLFVLAVSSGVWAQPMAPTRLGAGLSGVTDWSRTNEFVDLTKQGRHFGTPSAPWDEAAVVDDRGWPSDDAGVVLMCCQVPGPGLEGVYRVSMRCAATPTLEVRGCQVRGVSRDAETGLVTGEIVAPPGVTQIFLAIRGTQGGFRDLSVVRPGLDGGERFTPWFLDHNARFEVVRSMDWTRTNFNETRVWAERTLPEDATWRWKTGVPYEVLAEAANRMGKDLWVNVPAKADDDFVRRMARVIRDRLDPSLAVYVEYSNEVWNWSFSQAVWNWQEAVAEATAGGSDLSYDGSMDHNYLRWRRAAREQARVGRLFVEEFGEGSFGTRVRPVLASQFAWADQYRVQLEYLQATRGDPSTMVYAIAGAPYFGIGAADQRTDLSSGEVLDALEASAGLLAGGRSYEKMAAYTAWWGLRPFMGYEAGPDMAGANNLAAKREASYSPRMRAICRDYLTAWAQGGGGLVCWFVSGAGDWMSRSGSWPVTETMADQATPKIQALDDYAALGEVPLTIGQQAPGLLDARRHLTRRDDWESFPGTGIVGAGGRFDYLVRAPRGGRMRLRVLAACWIPGAALTLEVNQRGLGSVSLPVTGGWRNPNTAWSDPVEVEVPEGLSVVRLTTNVAYGHDLVQLVLACPADLNTDGFLDFFDYDAMVGCFAGEGCPGGVSPDFNQDGFVDFFDYDAFVEAFEEGC